MIETHLARIPILRHMPVKLIARQVFGHGGKTRRKDVACQRASPHNCCSRFCVLDVRAALVLVAVWYLPGELAIIFCTTWRKVCVLFPIQFVVYFLFS